ncbi:thiamine diphosphokinase [Campylobacter canadensis]|uniref:Thiamine diphosphokinase n=1 Tax=Campylobacter canadensis TaxID=449520 RepID=A0ABS7WP37_9BACT|nr:thiamine diphosphokinase [Campylobacter canadensis]MBZ7986523.1 thiamine diphosphokinase [Campylobacter canadensis]MBZ7997559.1 thiamine diphosphokinase [Campylobacter canadensis]
MLCVIVANGQKPKTKIELDTINKADYVIACDGAANWLLENNFKIDVIIGDLDSLKIYNKNIKIKKINNQSTNDLTKAFKYALSLNFNKIYFIACHGKREDHFIANFALLNCFAKLKNKDKTQAELKMITNYGEFLVLRKSCEVSVKKNQQISLFALNPNTIASSNGLKYELNNFKFKNLYCASLNEAAKNKVQLHLNDIILFYILF